MCVFVCYYIQWLAVWRCATRRHHRIEQPHGFATSVAEPDGTRWRGEVEPRAGWRRRAGANRRRGALSLIPERTGAGGCRGLPPATTTAPCLGGMDRAVFDNGRVHGAGTLGEQCLFLHFLPLQLEYFRKRQTTLFQQAIRGQFGIG